MKGMLIFLAAALMAGLAGAWIGDSIDTQPIINRDGSTLPQGAMITSANDSLRDRQATPDHYPLQTPDGTIEVYELSRVNRIHTRSEAGWWDDAADRRAAENPVNFYDEAERRSLAEREAALARIPRIEARVDARLEERTPANPTATNRQRSLAEAPMALAEMNEPARPATPKGKNGSVRVVNVADELAKQD